MSANVQPMAHHRVTRYLTPLREGGSLPGLVEADDEGTYVMKLRSAGQGPRVLASEVIVASLAERLGLRVPDLALLDLDASIGLREPDPEIQHLLVTSAGMNLGMDYLPGSIGFDPTAFQVDPTYAATIIWLDAFTANVDRSHRNPNLLMWHGNLWCIDHGVALGFQHNWSRADRFPTAPFDASDHVLAEHLGHVAGVATALAARIDAAAITEALALVPDVWLGPDPDRPDAAAPTTAHEARERIAQLLDGRLAAMADWCPGLER